MSDHAADEDPGPGRDLDGLRFDASPFGIVLDQIADSGPAERTAYIGAARFVRAGQEVEAAVLQGRIVERDPQHNALRRVEGIHGIVDMEVGGVGPWRLDQRVVVVEADAGRAR